MGQEGRMKDVETGRERGFKVKVGRVKGEKGEKLTIVHRKGGVRSGRSTIERHRRFKLPRRRRHLNVVLVVDRGRRQQVFHRFDVAGTLFADA